MIVDGEADLLVADQPSYEGARPIFAEDMIAWAPALAPARP